MDQASMEQLGMLVENRKFDETLRQARQYQGDWYAHYMAGMALRGLERFEEAQDEYEKSIALKDDSAPVHMGIGIVQQHLGRYDAAIKSLNTAIRLKPDLYAAYNSLGMTYRMIGRYQEGFDVYEYALSLMTRLINDNLSNDPECYKTEEIDGKQTRTMFPAAFDKAKALMKTNLLYAVLTNNAGCCLEGLGKLDEARDYFVEAIDITPDGFNYTAPIENLQRLG